MKIGGNSMKKLTLVVDMYGCPNRCKHCWLGHMPNRTMSENSDTLHITRAFLEGMQAASPQDIHIIHTIDQHIEYCTGCFSCMRNGGSCIHNDDM